jgi:hypothetical protein
MDNNPTKSNRALYLFSEKCSTFGANSKFLCFKTVMDEITVKMGSGKNDGTNDDVTVTVKSDLDATETCTTKLSSALAGEN